MRLAAVMPILLRMVAPRSAGEMGLSAGCSPRLSDAPIKAPPRIPPPARAAE